MRNDRQFRDCACSALYVTCFKIDMTTTYFWPPIRFFASHTLKDDLTRFVKNSFHFTLQMKCLVSFLWKPLHRLFVKFGTLESETAHFCTSCRHLKLARKNSRLVSSPASHHGLAKSIISSDFRAVFYSFSLRDNFYPDSHSIRRAACFWHDEKYNSDERDTRLKR